MEIFVGMWKNVTRMAISCSKVNFGMIFGMVQASVTIR